MPLQLPGYLPSNTLPSVVWHGLVWLGSSIFTRVRVASHSSCMQLFLCFYVIVYGDLHYLDAVHKEAEYSMLSSVAEVQTLPHYAQQGEVQLTEMLP